MNLPYTIAQILGHSNRVTPEFNHKWNQLMGLELELENVSGMERHVDVSRFPYEDYEDWEDLGSDEQEDIIQEWLDNHPPVGGLPAGWTTHSDMSLRNGTEFVTVGAVGGQDMENCINAFYGMNYTYDGGPRTSTHIHVNVLDAPVAVVQSLVMLTYMIEPALYRVVDENRKYSSYSTALVDMPPSRLRNLLNPPNREQFTRAINVYQNRERYYGLNFNIARHGTVEFRYFPGAPTKEELISWVDLVVALKKAAHIYTPEILGELCQDTASFTTLLRSVLGEWADKLLSKSSIEELRTALEEIVAIRTDESNPERPASVVKVSPNFLQVLLTSVIGEHEETVTYLKNSCESKLLSIEDIKYFVESARTSAIALEYSKGRVKVLDAVTQNSFEEVDAPMPPRRAPSYITTFGSATELPHAYDTWSQHIYNSLSNAESTSGEF